MIDRVDSRRISRNALIAVVLHALRDARVIVAVSAETAQDIRAWVGGTRCGATWGLPIPRRLPSIDIVVARAFVRQFSKLMEKLTGCPA
jgi:hypothetical protein